MRNKIIVSAIIVLLLGGNIYFYKRWQSARLLSRINRQLYIDHKKDVRSKMAIIDAYMSVAHKEHIELSELRHKYYDDLEEMRVNADDAAIEARNAAYNAEEANQLLQELKEERDKEN